MEIKPWNKDLFKNISFDDIDNAINEISKIENIDTYKNEDIHALFFKYFNGLPIPVLFFQSEILKDLKVYRARPCDQIKNNEINKIVTYSSPPDSHCVTGRANWEKRSVFYASDSQYAALKEAKDVYPEKEFYVAKWGFDYNKLGTERTNVATLVIDNIPNENPWVIISEAYKIYIEKLQIQIGIENSEKSKYLTQKICKLFVDLDKSKYKITAYLADQRIYCKHNTPNEIYFPILIYPSVETGNRNCNFAIHPLFVKQYMKLETVLHIKLSETSQNYFKQTIEKIGYCSSSSEIEWYTLFLNFSKALYSIQSFSCYPSDKNPDLDKIIFKRNNQIISHGEMIVDFLEERDYSDFYDLSNFMEGDGIPFGMSVEFPALSLSNIAVTIDGKEYKDFTMDVTVNQPYEYKKAL